MKPKFTCQVQHGKLFYRSSADDNPERQRLSDIKYDLLVITGFAVVFNAGALLNYRKTS